MSKSKTLGVLAAEPLVQQHQFRKVGPVQPGHSKDVSSGHKMTMVNSKGKTTTSPGATGGSNKGIRATGKMGQPTGHTGQPAGVATRKRMA